MKKGIIFLLIYLSINLILISCAKQKRQEQTSQTIDTTQQVSQTEKQPVYATTPSSNRIVVLKTTKGDIELEVFEKESPNHAGNFMKLVNNGYFDGVIFHRVVPDVVVETGDPTGTGSGSPGYDLEPEKTSYSNKAGFVGMLPLQNGKSNGSQFYILVKDNPRMDEKTSCFAKVISGTENVLAISKVPAKKERPIESVKIIAAALKQVVAPIDSANQKTSETPKTK